MIDQAIAFGPTFRVAAACLFIHIYISYLIKGIVVCQAAHSMVDPEFSSSADRSPRSWFGWSAVVLAVLVAAYFAGNLVPFFGDAVNLLGASFTPWVCWVLPIVFFWRMYSVASDRPPVGRFERPLMTAEVVLACTLMVFGTVFAVQALCRKWETYGYPFECHCEDVWKTCACSGSHVGMEEECLLN
mmetsp:Transcript_84555/g.244282  ORF Transcript_84555/g.244282 Transcript_84555/m.244282 type:complete len:187 (-) Transcript_84555:430-990(-)